MVHFPGTPTNYTSSSHSWKMVLKPLLPSHNFPLGKYFTATADIYNVTAASKLSDSPEDTNDVKDGSF